MKTKEQIENELNKLKEKRMILHSIIEEIEIEDELAAKSIHKKINSFSKEINTLEWVLNIDLPF